MTISRFLGARRKHPATAVGRTRRHGRRLTALVIAVFMVLAGALQGCANKEESKKITIAEGKGYADDVAINALWKHLLEEKGWKVEIKPLDLGVMFAGLSQGDVDAYLDTWLPVTHGPYVKKYKGKFEVLKTPFNKEAKLGLAVPAYSKMRTLDDLRAHSGDLNGEITGIEPSTGEMKLLKKKIMPAYKLNGRLNLVSSSSPAMLAALQKAITKKKEVAVALWKPHDAWSKYNIRFLEDPKKAWPAAERVHIGLSNDFADDNPQAKKWLGRTKLNATQWSSLMAQVEKHGRKQGVSAWLKKPANRKLAESWVR